MSEQTEGVVLSEASDHILKIIISNPTKKDAFHPDMMLQLSNALTELNNNQDLWVGVITAEGENFTAGLDMLIFRSERQSDTDPRNQYQCIWFRQCLQQTDRHCRTRHLLYDWYRNGLGR